MPRRPVGRRLTIRNVARNNRYGGVARALVRGTAMAYRNRAAISAATRSTVRGARSLFSKATSYLRKRYQPKRVLRDTDRLQQDIGTGAELTKEHVTIGRAKKLKVKGYAGKLIKSSEQTQILRFSGVSPFMTISQPPLNQKKTEVGGGAYWLHNWFDGSAFWYAPCHVYDVTSINNVISQSGSAVFTQATPGWQLRFATTNPGVVSPTDVSFANLNNQLGATGQPAGGVWQGEDTAALVSNAGSQPLRRTLQDWTQAKLLCYGSAKMVTEYVIEFIQLKEDWLHMEFCNLSNPTQTGEDFHASSIQFWENYVKSQMAHPCATTAPLARNKYRVLKTIRFTLQPRLSTETDANVGHCKQINIFYHMNRLCKYDWAENATDLNPGNGALYAVNQGALSTYVHPKARIYMTIRALNPNYANNTIPVTDFTPSYDLVLRKKFTTMQ